MRTQSIQKLRTIVENGWTIARRKQVASTLGKKSATELSELSFRSSLGMDIFNYPQIEKELTPTNLPNLTTFLKKKLGLIERQNPKVSDDVCTYSYCYSHYDDTHRIAYGYALPNDYINRQGDIPVGKPYYYIESLISYHPGGGTTEVQKVVQKSLATKNTQGRVMLNCDTIDENRPCAAGFYYKLGFRFLNPSHDAKMQQWMKDGANKATAPRLYGYMYLPKENLFHCLSYGY